MHKRIHEAVKTIDLETYVLQKATRFLKVETCVTFFRTVINLSLLGAGMYKRILNTAGCEGHLTHRICYDCVKASKLCFTLI